MSWSYSFNGTIADARKHVGANFYNGALASPGEEMARDAAKLLIQATLYGGEFEEGETVDISAFGHEQSESAQVDGAWKTTKRRQNLKVSIEPRAKVQA